MMAKKLFGLVLILILVLSVSVSAKISKQKLNDREKFASDLITGDEEFLSDYIDKVPEDRLMKFYEKAIDMAIKIADETVNIKNDDKAYEYIVQKVDGKGGVKDIIEEQVKRYLNRDVNDRAFGRYARINIENSPYYYALMKIKENIRKIRLQKSVFSY
jgi:hypothetical protein